MEDRENVLGRVRRQIQTVVRGQTEAIEQLLVALIAGGHVLLEGVPGVAKTLLARSTAMSLDLEFRRIQFTPDLMPADVTGVSVYMTGMGRFEFQPGPIFTDVLLADEINRAPAKTQAALLEGMQENQVSIDNRTYPLSEEFMVIATQNPIEYEGVYPLPEAQLDRFLMKILMNYPDRDAEREMLLEMHRLGERAKNPASALEPVLSKTELRLLRRAIDEVALDDSVVDFILNIIRESRALSLLNYGASPRAGVMLMRAAKASAVVTGRGFVTPEDVVGLAAPVLRHRVQLTPEAQIEGMTPDGCIETLMRQVKVPR